MVLKHTSPLCGGFSPILICLLPVKALIEHIVSVAEYEVSLIEHEWAMNFL